MEILIRFLNLISLISSVSMDLDDTPKGPQLDFSEKDEERECSSPSSLPPPPPSPADNMANLMRFMSKKFPPPQSARSKRAPGEVNQLLNDPSIRPMIPMTPPPQFQDPTQMVIKRILPYALGAFAFFLGSGFGLGWLVRGWYGSSPTPKSKNSSPSSTIDPLTGDDYSKIEI